MKALLLSDIVIPFIYSPQIKERFADVDLIIGCGDLPYYYQEYVLSLLDVPLYYVRGNHSKEIEFSTGAARSSPMGGVDLHRQVVVENGMIFAGVDGSLRYRDGPYQYSQAGMWMHVFHLVPLLLANRLAYGRYLDVFITHAPPWHIHDAEDLPHRGIKAFRWFIHVFKPAFLFHGHIHLYHPDSVVETQVGATRIINAFGWREVEIQPARAQQPVSGAEQARPAVSQGAILDRDRKKS